MADAHLVGSMNVADAEAAERGRRAGRVRRPGADLMQTPGLESVVQPPGEYGSSGQPRIEFRPREGVVPEGIEIAFPYAEDAIASHGLLRRFIERGEIAPHT